jgi:hypothetical protein
MQSPLQNEATTQTILFVRSRRGYHLAVIPGDMDGDAVEAAFRELRISPLQVCEISRFQETAAGMKVANLPHPPMN